MLNKVRTGPELVLLPSQIECFFLDKILLNILQLSNKAATVVQRKTKLYGQDKVSITNDVKLSFIVAIAEVGIF